MIIAKIIILVVVIFFNSGEFTLMQKNPIPVTKADLISNIMAFLRRNFLIKWKFLRETIKKICYV